ncbi:MAG: hypothetical protein Q9227_005366 [Pyrenula ochraceoflavens]
MPAAGPQLPPFLRAKRKREDDDDGSSNSSDDSNTSQHTQEDSRRNKSRIIGPTLPPADPAELPPKPPESDGSSSDDDFGPSLPTKSQKAPRDSSSPSEPVTTAVTNNSESLKPQRDEWMMLPPPDGDWSSRVDPTKLRNRKFNTNKGAKGPSQTHAGGIDVKWTETPAEKAARLEREMLGIKDPGEARKKDSHVKHDEASLKRVREHSEKAKGPSLYQEHQRSKPREKEDDPSARAFDREKDIGSIQSISRPASGIDEDLIFGTKAMNSLLLSRQTNNGNNDNNDDNFDDDNVGWWWSPVQHTTSVLVEAIANAIDL